MTSSASAVSTLSEPAVAGYSAKYAFNISWQVGRGRALTTRPRSPEAKRDHVYWRKVGDDNDERVSNRAKPLKSSGAPYGNRTRVSAVKGRRPGPLDEGRGPRANGAVGRARDIKRFAGCGKEPAAGCFFAELSQKRPRHAGRSSQERWEPGKPRSRSRSIEHERRLEPGARRLTNARYWASRSMAPWVAALRPSAAARWIVCRASGRTPSCRRAADG